MLVRLRVAWRKLLLLVAMLLHLIPRLGALETGFGIAVPLRPALDWVIAYFTVAPDGGGADYCGERVLWGRSLGRWPACCSGRRWHEFVHRNKVKSRQIVSLMNEIVGPWRNHAAIWLTAIVTPLFTLVRMAEAFVYPPISWLVGFPRYESKDWVNVSRQKFKGLVGHDLIWCLYCDWMTGVWSLGSEMLRNVESFWCPIRFASDKKCANCSVDFPDISGGWVAADGDMAQVISVLEEQHRGANHGWFGHPVRITVRGSELVGSK